MMKQDWTERFQHTRRVLIKSPLLGQFVCVESLVTAVVDMYPETFRRGYRRELLILGMSVVSFLIGLIMCTEVGLTLTFTSSSSLPSLCRRYDSSIVSEVIGWLMLWSLWPSWDVLTFWNHLQPEMQENLVQTQSLGRKHWLRCCTSADLSQFVDRWSAQLLVPVSGV